MKQELDRAKAIKRLLDREIERTDSTKDMKRRIAEAGTALDERVGNQWRIEIKLPGVDMAQVEEPVECDEHEEREGLDQFYDRVRAALQEDDEPGFEAEMEDVPDERMQAKREGGSDRTSMLRDIIARLQKML